MIMLIMYLWIISFVISFNIYLRAWDKFLTKNNLRLEKKDLALLAFMSITPLALLESTIIYISE